MAAHCFGLTRRTALARLASFAAVPWIVTRPLRASTRHRPGTVMVYKRVGCSCCTRWAAHLVTQGFDVRATEEPDLDLIKDRLGVPLELRGCHTAVLQGYLVEGHVPADVITQLLEQRLEVAGLAVPAMPVGSPGMEVEGAASTPYDVFAFQRDGTSSVFAARG